MELDQITGMVTAVSGSACFVDRVGNDAPIAIPVNVTDVQVGDRVVLFPVGTKWYVNAVLPRPEGSGA